MLLNLPLAGLDFLGFGLPPGSASLGEMVNQGRNNLQAPFCSRHYQQIMSKDKSDIEPSDTNIITTLVFIVRSIPASLYKCLGGFASNGVNITKLESYIHPQGFDVAQFYIDFEGHPENNSVKLALEEMKFFCKEIKILGVYKKSNFRKK